VVTSVEMFGSHLKTQRTPRLCQEEGDTDYSRGKNLKVPDRIFGLIVVSNPLIKEVCKFVSGGLMILSKQLVIWEHNFHVILATRMAEVEQGEA